MVNKLQHFTTESFVTPMAVAYLDTYPGRKASPSKELSTKEKETTTPAGMNRFNVIALRGY